MKSFFVFVCAALAGTLVATSVAVAELKVGDKVPDFKLKDLLSGQEMALSDLTGKGPVMVEFISFKCPYSLSYDARFVELAKGIMAKRAQLVALSPNNAESEEELARTARARGITFPILKDWNNKIADLFGAQYTPHVYIINKDGVLVYAGQAGDHIHADQMKTFTCAVALDDVLAGKPVSNPTTKAAGRTIKRDYNAKNPR
jgi:peroxiredoxin